MNRYNLKQVVPTDYITVKMAAQLTGMTANAIKVAGYSGKIDMVRAGSGGWAADRKSHNEVSLRSLYEYISTRDPRGRRGQLRNVSGGRTS
jgi:hypothetical protein|tara:strand:- start:382 stop:654 length:273 start_codon:yes stop_codon:yes gene_type:complete